MSRRIVDPEGPAAEAPLVRVRVTHDLLDVAQPHARTQTLVRAVQDLSMARTLDTVMAIVREAARELTGADGATFVLRDGEQCYYAEEHAIGPLWKGRRFPLQTCISGWTMVNRQPVVIRDIFEDARIPHDAYRPTFVKSLAMVPIRTADPLGAIGTYWAVEREASEEEVRLLQALADSTSVAMENVRLVADLEARVRDRTMALEAANTELEAFTSAVSHDLRGPLSTIGGLAEVLAEDEAGRLSEDGLDMIVRIGGAARRLSRMVDDLLRLSRATRAPLERTRVDLSAMAASIVDGLRAASPDRQVEVTIAAGLSAHCDAGLTLVVLENLLGNAWKFTSRRAGARIVFALEPRDGVGEFVVRDNGAGFDPRQAGRLFGVFQRLHAQAEFPGTGVGLCTVQRIIRKHGGTIRAEGAVNEGAAFAFTLGVGGRD
jgi:K+-sensing histidine kinase KdpD